MSTELATIERASLPAVIITNDQTALIKETVAKGATDAELALYVYDCTRRGVHPLDRLIHFTKRGGKYTPVTSIDMFRSRAAGSREHMGTDDTVFVGQPGDLDFAASVTVYRLVKGEKCPFTATARMSEYMPDPPNDFMWKKMPHGQLGKCAEALALRKGFPQELEGLHSFEEMNQAGVIDHEPQPAAEPKQPQRRSETGNGTTSKTSKPIPEHAKVVVGVIGKTYGDKKPFALYLDERKFTTFDETLWADIMVFAGTSHRVKLAYTETVKDGRTFLNEAGISIADAEPVTSAPPLTADDIFDRDPGAEG